MINRSPQKVFKDQLASIKQKEKELKEKTKSLNKMTRDNRIA